MKTNNKPYRTCTSSSDSHIIPEQTVLVFISYCSYYNNDATLQFVELNSMFFPAPPSLHWVTTNGI